VKIVGFSEGPRGDSPGIVSVPTILKSTAEHGHQVVLLMGGAVNAETNLMWFLTQTLPWAGSRAKGRLALCL